MKFNQHYFARIVAAFVRGKLVEQYKDHPLFIADLDGLSFEECEELAALGREQKLKLHKFKRNVELPRVKAVLGILKGLQPDSLLDIGSGRGAFLWPLIDAFPHLPVISIDVLDHRVSDVNAVRRGGISRVKAHRMSATAMDFDDFEYDVITFLETLEHIPDTRAAVREACRVAARFIVVSVPSKPDENPEHIHLFDKNRLSDLFLSNGMKNIKFTFILNHIIALVKK